MVQRKSTGWEYLAYNPVAFFEDVLLLQVSNEHKAWMNAVADGSRDRLGLVWRPTSGDFEADEASIACGMVLWAAACHHRPTLLWGGRRHVARAWVDHTATILRYSTQEFRNGYTLLIDDDKPIGLVSSGSWVLRFDGGFREDPINGAHALGYRANVLIGDFSWTDREIIDDALDYADGHDALATLMVGHGRS